MIVYILIIAVILFSILFGVLFSIYKSRKHTTKGFIDRSLQSNLVLPDKNKTPVLVCDPNNIPPKWPFNNYDFDGISIFSSILERAYGEPRPGSTWSVFIDRVGDQLLWVAGFVPGTIVQINFSNVIVVTQIADENGFIYVTNNVPLPTAVIIDEMTIIVIGICLVNGFTQRSTTSGIQPMSYNITTDMNKQLDCNPNSVIWGVYATVSETVRKNMATTSIEVTFPTTIIGIKELDAEGRIVQKIDYTTISYVVHNGSLYPQSIN